MPDTIDLNKLKNANEMELRAAILSAFCEEMRKAMIPYWVEWERKIMDGDPNGTKPSGVICLTK